MYAVLGVPRDDVMTLPCLIGLRVIYSIAMYCCLCVVVCDHRLQSLYLSITE